VNEVRTTKICTASQAVTNISVCYQYYF